MKFKQALRMPDGQVSRMADQVIDLGEGHQVFFKGRLLPATFNSKGAAEAYLIGLKKGRPSV